MQKVARRQKRSGRPIKGERSNRGLWRYIAGLDAAVAWQVAAAIVAWAVAAGLQVLVFEHLRPYRPERGLSWSRRTSRKRAHWLRDQVLAHVRHLAAGQGSGSSNGTVPGPVRPARTAAAWARGSRPVGAAPPAVSGAGTVAGRATPTSWRP